LKDVIYDEFRVNSYIRELLLLLIQTLKTNEFKVFIYLIYLLNGIFYHNIINTKNMI